MKIVSNLRDKKSSGYDGINKWTSPFPQNKNAVKI